MFQNMAVVDIGPDVVCSNHTNCNHADQWGYFIINNIISVFILAENSITITLFLRYRFLQTSTNLLALSLSIADLLMGMIYPLYNVLNHTSFADHLMQQSPPVACSMSLYVILVATGASLLTILAISIDRYRKHINFVNVESSTQL